MTNASKALAVIEQLMNEGLMQKYAIGGAVGALFYLEPSQTEDIDIFIHLEPAPGSSMVSLRPIIDRLEALGHKEWREANIVIEDWPVQFVPVFKALEIEALAQASRRPLETEIQPFVMPPEYLMALALDLFRPKDKVRLEQFYRQHAYDAAEFDAILRKHGL
jgi:hypothetical protein